MNHTASLYWIIDGLDEAVDARSAIRLFQDLCISSVPIKVIVFSRKTPDIVAAMKKIPSSVVVEAVCIEGHLEDMYTHIRQELDISGTEEFKETIVHRIIEGSQNNFLVSVTGYCPLVSEYVLTSKWVRLAVEKLNSCHTLKEVEMALHELPPGMEALYHRMALCITQNPSPSGRALAKVVLQYVTCSFRALTVSELSVALDEDLSDMLNFQQSIVELCGGFIIVDNSGNVVIIHHSAREYLIANEKRPFTIDHAAANEQLFMSCMRRLMETGLRAKVGRGEIPGFLDYSANWWSSHLALLAESPNTVFKTVQKFLTGHWVLTWIQILSILRRLRILVRVSKHLSKYSQARQKAQNSFPNDVSQLEENEFLETWAVDLIKILGKFGTILRRHPDAIYKSIPPFCPHNSAIYQQFGKTEAKVLAVSGISVLDWDDSVARLAFDGYASYISAAGSQIAVLASSGKVSVYDASDFEEGSTSPINHGERVYRIVLNRTGTLMVTYGYQTTKIWEISTGNCKLSIKNPESRPRPLAMLFQSNDSCLLVGSDDRRIRALDLQNPTPTWKLVADFEEPELEGHFLNSSSYMSLNDKGDLLAVAYRGHPLSAWEVDGPVHINHCWRAREAVARGEVLEAMWHPHSPEILGLYIEGVVFKWNPYEGNPEELATGASRLAMSADGGLFATGDVQGTIKVYTTCDFRLLYQLASPDSVLGLTFSPGAHRFYDIRGSYGNVWEPNSLARWANRHEKGPDSDSETGSLEPGLTMTHTSPRRIDQISVVSASPVGAMYCCGTEYGKVQLFHTQHGFVSNLHISEGFLSIEQIVWSHDGQYVCFSDSGKQIFAFSISCQSGDLSSIKTNLVLEMPMKSTTAGAITQLLFTPNPEEILVSTSSSVSILSIKSGRVMQTLEWPFEDCKWFIYPQDPTLILWVSSQLAGTMNWSLAEIRKLHFELPLPAEPSKGSIDCALITHDQSHLLLQLSTGKTQKEKLFVWFSMSSISESLADHPTGASDRATITPNLLTEDLASRIALALSFLSQDRLVFLSKEYGVCSVRIAFGGELVSASATIRRSSNASVSSSGLTSKYNQNYLSSSYGEQAVRDIFLLPSDWLTKSCLAMCSVWSRERSFMCPRNGEVAVVKSAGLV
jgi:WD40 repeat protein